MEGLLIEAVRADRLQKQSIAGQVAGENHLYTRARTEQIVLNRPFKRLIPPNSLWSSQGNHRRRKTYCDALWFLL